MSFVDPRRKEKVNRYKPPQNQGQSGGSSEDLMPDYMNILGMIFSMCGLMMKLKWCAWFALYCSCISFASSRVSDDAKQQIDGYIAGIDYPAYESVPKGLSFNCRDRLPGYYADTETRCQVWHWCLHSGHQYSFICPNGTVFNQAVRVCDWWTNVNCPAAEQLYNNNDELYRPTELNPDQNL